MISIDPGANAHGWAVWKDGKLLKCAYGDVIVNPDNADLVVIELPQVYMGSKSKGNPNDLIKVAFSAGQSIGGFFVACSILKMPFKYETVSPRTWKGTIKKEAMLKRILTRLDDNELALLKGLGLSKSQEHNVIDGIGIGLWKLGRL